MRIAIVNDLLVAVEAMRRILTRDGRDVVVWVAQDGEEAVARCKRDRPDLILMDLVMPRLDGVEATRRIMANTPCAIVVVTASATDQTSKVFEAMGAGALDAVNTPILAEAGAAALLAKVETIRKLVADENWRPGHRSGGTTRHLRRSALVAIGASAGGPAALARVLSGLPEDFPASVVVVQHVDAQFAAGLGHWLAIHCQLPVRLIEEGDAPRAGHVLLAGRDHHLVISASERLGYSRASADCTYRPSVDLFFKSVAEHWRHAAAGVLLTGMGRDGAEGLLAMRRRGFETIVQDEATSAVYGMPKAAVELNAAAEILALDKIAGRLVNIFELKAPGPKKSAAHR